MEPLFEKGEEVLYLVDKQKQGQWAKAKIVDVHIDLPDPPFYTILYHKLEEEELVNSPGRASLGKSRGGRGGIGGSLSGSGAHIKSPMKKQKLVKHEKQTTQNRLKKR